MAASSRLHITRLGLIGALLIGLSGVALAHPSGLALAHASLVTSSIRPGAVLHSAPRTLSAIFSEDVNPRGSFLRVFENVGDHAEIDLGNSQVSFKNARQMTVSLPAHLAKEQYMVMWYTISATDGHHAGSAFTFTIK